MNNAPIISSPQASLADLFLDAMDTASSKLLFSKSSQHVNNTFSELLKNSLNNTMDIQKSTPDFKVGARPVEKVRCDPVEELEHKIEDVGMPLKSMSLNKKDLDTVRDFLEEGGFSADQVNQVMSRISKGPLTMDRVLAAVKSVVKPTQSSMTLSDESIPMLGRFLQEMGLSAEEVKDVLSGLKAGQKFGASQLKDILLKYGKGNLRGPALGNADMQNLKDMLASMGMDQKDLQNLFDKIEKTGGRLSLEGLLSFMESVDRPEALTASQLENIEQIINKMKLSDSLKKQPKFNRIISMLQAMGDKNVDENFLNSNPAIQALRGGSTPSNALNSLGRNSSGNSNNGNGNQHSFQPGMSGAEAKSEVRTGIPRAAQTTFTSRLSESALQQISDKMSYHARNGVHSMKLQLTPAELGKLDINLVMKNNGLHATIIAENPHVKDAMSEQLNQLKETLAAQGLELESFDVSCQSDHRQPEFGTDRRKSSNTGLSSQQVENEIEEAAATATLSGESGYVDRMI